MNTYETAIWSACLGVYFCVWSLSVFYVVYNRSLVGFQTMVSIAISGFFVASTCGLLEHLKIVGTGLVWQKLTLLSGPVAASIASIGLRRFLRAEQRDQWIDWGSKLVLTLCVLPMFAVFWSNRQQALLGIGATLTVAAFCAFWISLRARLLVDRLALAMTLACLFMVFGVMGLYALALEMIKNRSGMQALAALSCAVFVVLSTYTLKRRNDEYLRMRRALTMSRDKDLLTQLWTGAALIRCVADSIVRARRNRKEMAVICVEISNTGQLTKEFGHHGLEQVIYSMAARVRHAVHGEASTVGRYSDNSFVVVIDSVKKPAVLRSIGLRLAVAVRRPFVINPYSANPRDFRADVGVGVAHIATGRELRKRGKFSDEYHSGFDSYSLAQDVLHEAAELAVAARSMGSRAAIMDAYSRKPIAIEMAG